MTPSSFDCLPLHEASLKSRWLDRPRISQICSRITSVVLADRRCRRRCRRCWVRNRPNCRWKSRCSILGSPLQDSRNSTQALKLEMLRIKCKSCRKRSVCGVGAEKVVLYFAENSWKSVHTWEVNLWICSAFIWLLKPLVSNAPPDCCVNLLAPFLPTSSGDIRGQLEAACKYWIDCTEGAVHSVWDWHIGSPV